MDGKTFEHILSNLNPVIGLLLVGLNRFEEAFPLLKQGFETGREADDREMIFLCGWEIGYILVIDASEPDAAAALPYLTESLAAVTEAEERQYNILEFVVLCLWYLEEQGELAHLADLKSILVLLETGLERARRAGDTDRIAILVYIIGLIHLRVEHSDKALPYFVEGLKFFGSDPQYLFLTWFVECLSDVKRGGRERKHLDALERALVLLETKLEGARQAKDATLVAAIVFAMGVTPFNAEAIR